MSHEPKWVAWARELQAIGQTALSACVAPKRLSSFLNSRIGVRVCAEKPSCGLSLIGVL